MKCRNNVGIDNIVTPRWCLNDPRFTQLGYSAIFLGQKVKHIVQSSSRNLHMISSWRGPNADSKLGESEENTAICKGANTYSAHNTESGHLTVLGTLHMWLSNH